MCAGGRAPSAAGLRTETSRDTEPTGVSLMWDIQENPPRVPVIQGVPGVIEPFSHTTLRGPEDCKDSARLSSGKSALMRLVRKHENVQAEVSSH